MDVQCCLLLTTIDHLMLIFVKAFGGFLYEDETFSVPKLLE